MKRYNKTTATIVAGAIIAVIGSFYSMTPEISTSVQTLLTMAFVWFIPNE
jgi:hypothetical protein